MKVLTEFIFVLWWAGIVWAQNPQVPAPPIAITGVTVIDASGAPAQPNQTVIVRGNRIAEVGPQLKVKVPSDAVIIDGRGKFLIPGLWDMHTHVAGISADPAWGDKLLPVYLAHGVTGIRDMAGNLEKLLEWKEEQARGELVGPRMVVSGPFLDGSADGFTFKADVVVVTTPYQAQAAVQDLARRGADFIKIGSRISPEVFQAIADEAKRQKLAFLGHLPEGVTVARASDTGMKSIEHVNGFALAVSAKEEELRKQLRDTEAKKDWAVVVKTNAEIAASLSPEKANVLFAKLVKNQTWQVPTLVWTKTTSTLDQVGAGPHLKYLPAKLQAEWAPEKIRKSSSATALAYYAVKLKSDMKLVGMMAKAGVPLLAGTDSLDPYVFPGDSIHKELVLVVEAGLTPMQALQCATRNPAMFFGTQKELGTVESGKLADLLLLDADPLKDIANTQKISGVMLNGKYYPRAELEKMLKGVEQDMAEIK